MKVIFLKNGVKPEFGTLNLAGDYQTKFGLIRNLGEKLELVTTERITDYYVHTNESGKTYLAICDNSQMGEALHEICNQLGETYHLTFKPRKEKLYIKVGEDLVKTINKNQSLLISVSVHAVFDQGSSKTSFLQFHLTDFKSFPLVDFSSVN